jgi:protoporphyrinogen oxidase
MTATPAGDVPGRDAAADVVVLGAGPAGLGAAYRLAGDGWRVVALEAADRVGGLASIVEVGGMRVDVGSHRLHPSTAPAILAHLRALPGVELQRRPRRGRIRLAGRWIAFPLRIGDALRHLPPGFAAGLAIDALTRPVRRIRLRRRAGTFADVLEAGVGPTLARRFYFPYARKIWGVEPAALSGEQARRRVGANSLPAIARRMLRARREPPAFWYPARGFGALAEGLAAAARDRGADIRTGARVTRVARHGDAWRVEAADGTAVSARQVWSTLPLPLLAGIVWPAPPDDVAAAVAGLRYRGMLLVYLVLDRERYTTTDAHYLPEGWTPVTRISEPRNYRDGPDPDGRTVLCAELPCAPGDHWWTTDDTGLADVVADTLAAAGLDRPRPAGVVVHRRAHAYPIATVDSAARLARVERWAAGLDGVLTVGRQGLFAHDNTHHALAMAWAAADALRPDGTLDRRAWDTAREGFRDHVVED